MEVRPRGEGAAYASRDHIRIFISSTFRDMQEERDELVKNVYPELKELCLKRGVHLTFVDLRWGITDEQAELGRVIPLCLQEIDNCRPFFVGILGERYGWVPEELDPQLFGAYPWLRAHGQISMTEMEIRHGVLNDPSLAPHAFFYFRDPAYITGLPAHQQTQYRDQDPALAAKLKALKTEIQGTACSVRVNYATPQSLADLVRAGLQRLIEAELSYDKLVDREQVPTYREIMGRDDLPKGTPAETFQHLLLKQRLFTNRLKFLFIGRKTQLEALDHFATGNGSFLVIHGPPGIGKSALIAHWSERYESAGNETRLAVCHVESTSLRRLDEALLRLAWQLSDQFELGRQVNLMDAGRDVFQETLEEAAARGEAIVVIDGVDHIEEEGRDLTWLPDLSVDGVKIIVTVRDTAIIQGAPGGLCEAWELEGLSYAEQSEFVTGYLAKFGKALSAGHLSRILEEEGIHNPLYLKTLLDELQVFGIHEQLDETIDDYLDADSLLDLREKMLARLEADFGDVDTSVVPVMFRSILSTRSKGLSEEDLQTLLSLSPIRWSELYFATRGLLKKEKGLLKLRDDDLAAVVAGRYPGGQDTHAALAGLFREHKDHSRAAYERPFHLLQAEDWEALREALINPDLISSYEKEDLHEYWAALAGRYDLETEYLRVVDKIEPTSSVAEHTLLVLGKFLAAEGAVAVAERALRKAMTLLQGRDYQNPLVAEAILRELAFVSIRGQRLEEAQVFLERALALGEDAYNRTVLGTVAHRQGELEQAEDHFRRALELAQNSALNGAQLQAVALTGLGKTLAQGGRYADAEEAFRQAIDIDTAESLDTVRALAELLGEQGRDKEAAQWWAQALTLAEALPNPDEGEINSLRIGYIRALVAGGELDRAKRELDRALRIAEAAHGPNARPLVDWLFEYGNLLRDLGQYDNAVQHLRRALSILESHGEGESSEAAVVLTGQGWALFRLRKYEEAESAYQRALAILEQTQDQDLSRAHVIRYLANLLANTGRDEAAAERYRQALSIYEESDEGADYHIAATLVGMGLLQAMRGEQREARQLYRRAVGIFETLYGAEHISVGTTLLNLARSFYEDERYAKAEDAYRRAVAIYRANYGEGHIEVAGPLNGLAMALMHQDCLAEAETLSRQAIAITEAHRGAESVDSAKRMMTLGDILMWRGGARQSTGRAGSCEGDSDRSRSRQSPDRGCRDEAESAEVGSRNVRDPTLDVMPVCTGLFRSARIIGVSGRCAYLAGRIMPKGRNTPAAGGTESVCGRGNFQHAETYLGSLSWVQTARHGWLWRGRHAGRGAATTSQI
jgi:nephrocystin-3